MVIQASPELQSLFCTGQVRWAIAQIDVQAELIVERSHGERGTETEKQAFEEMRNAISTLGIEECFVLFRRDDGRISLIQLLRQDANIKYRMLYSSSTIGFKRSFGLSNFDQGFFAETPDELTYDAYCKSREFKEELDTQVFTEQERMRREERAHVDMEQNEQTANATGRVLAAATINFAFDDDLVAMLRNPEGKAILFGISGDEQFYLKSTCDASAEAIAAAVQQQPTCFVYAQLPDGSSFFIYYVTHESPMRDRVMMSSAKGNVKDFLKQLGYNPVCFEAGAPEDIETRIKEANGAPRPLIESADVRARPRPQRRR